MGVHQEDLLEHFVHDQTFPREFIGSGGDEAPHILTSSHPHILRSYRPTRVSSLSFSTLLLSSVNSSLIVSCYFAFHAFLRCFWGSGIFEIKSESQIIRM